MRIASMLSSSLDGCAQHPTRETMMRLVVVATPARQFIYFEHYFDAARAAFFRPHSRKRCSSDYAVSAAC